MFQNEGEVKKDGVDPTVNMMVNLRMAKENEARAFVNADKGKRVAALNKIIAPRLASLSEDQKAKLMKRFVNQFPDMANEIRDAFAGKSSDLKTA